MRLKQNFTGKKEMMEWVYNSAVLGKESIVFTYMNGFETKVSSEEKNRASERMSFFVG